MAINGFTISLTGFGLSWDNPGTKRCFSNDEVAFILALSGSVNDVIVVGQQLVKGFYIKLVRQLGHDQKDLDAEKYIPVYKSLLALGVLEHAGDTCFSLSGEGHKLAAKFKDERIGADLQDL